MRFLFLWTAFVVLTGTFAYDGSCDFENPSGGGLCGYRQDTTDQFDWTRMRGGTSSSGTGPSTDHTTRTGKPVQVYTTMTTYWPLGPTAPGQPCAFPFTYKGVTYHRCTTVGHLVDWCSTTTIYNGKWGNCQDQGWYVYIEATSKTPYSVARLIGPSLGKTTGSCLQFWTHMWGSHVGSLSVAIKSSSSTVTVWRKHGTQGDQWSLRKIDIQSSSSFSLIFEATRGSSYKGDIAIDDIKITPWLCILPSPVFSHCPRNVIDGTDPGVATRVVTWNVPTASDHAKNPTTVTVKPSHFVPPMKLGVGVFNIEYQTQDKVSRTSTCRFSITIKDLEPPTFGNTCPQSIIKYVDSKDDGIVTWTEPTATDNVGVDAVQKNNVKSKYPVGVTSVSYIARDAAGLTATCSFTIAIINICGSAPCGFGATCVLKNVNSYKCVCGSACPTDYNPVCGSDGKDYTNLCHMRLASCNAQKNITVVKNGKCVDECSSAPCHFGATCVLENGNAGYKCVCRSACTKENNPVCGSDGKDYTNECYLRLASCNAQKNITVAKKGNCDCGDLKWNAADKDSNSVDCTLVNNTFACKVKCKTGYEAPLRGFLNLVCENKKWIRGNNAGKHVPVNKSPPTCYEKVPASNSPCSSGFELMYPDVCVPCPPGSSLQNNQCQVCKVGEYQDVKAQKSCERCQSPKTSLTTGAESCYFNHSSNAIYMVFKAKETQQYSQDKLRTELANALTDYCSENKCSFDDNKTSRKRRDTGPYKFKKEDIVIVSEQIIDNTRKVDFFILDPTSKERVPAKAFSSENLKDLLLKVLEAHKLTLIEVESVGVVGTQTQPRSSDSKPNSGLIAGVTLGILCLIALAVGVFVFTRRRKQKNRLESSQVPPVQFSQESGGRVMQIGAPAAPPDQNYENPDAIENGVQHGFVNQVYSEVNQPPPYYATTPISGQAAGATALPDYYATTPIDGLAAGTTALPNQPHVYETPAGDQGEALPEKKPLPGDGVVDLIPPKQVDLSEEKHLKADLPVKYFQNRAPGNVYSLPRSQEPHYENAGAEGSLKLEPPPKYDDAKLRIIREQTASSILPNVPRKKDTNDNERGTTRGRDTVHDLRDVTKEQSES